MSRRPGGCQEPKCLDRNDHIGSQSLVSQGRHNSDRRDQEKHVRNAQVDRPDPIRKRLFFLLLVETRLRDAMRAGALDRAPGHMVDDLGLAVGVISRAEYDLLNGARCQR